MSAGPTSVTVRTGTAVPAPRAVGPPGAAQSGAAQPGAARSRPTDQEQGTSPCPVTLHRVICAQGLWAHPISLAAFLARRIPMLDQEEPERCPG